MRKVLISAAVAASALALASPAAAQYYPAPPPPPPYGYAPPGYGYAPPGNAYGYHNNWGHVRSLQARLDALQRQIRHLDNRDILSEREARRLRDQSREIERQLRYSARNGLNRREAYSIERRIALLEQRIWRDANDGRWNRGYGYGDPRYGYGDPRYGYGDNRVVHRDGRAYVRIPVRDDDD